MSEVEIFTPNVITVTDNAAKRVKFLINEEGKNQLMLRVFVTGGGCSGFQYGFTFDETLNDDDTIIEKMDIKVAIDSMSFQYISGSEIDFIEGLEGAKFVVNNPNASSTCGCGASFSL